MIPVINSTTWLSICEMSLVSLTITLIIFWSLRERRKYFENYIAKEHYTCGEPIKYIKKGGLPSEGEVIKESIGESDLSINWEKDCVYLVIFIIALICLLSII